MRVGAFLTYLAQLKGVSRDTAAARVPDLLERVGLRGTERTPCEELSKGMLQRVQFVGAILHEPELLILDEPFSGLDPVSVRLLREEVRRAHARGATILFSTHIMAYAEEMCDHVVMIHEGRKVLDEPMAGLRRQFDPRRILFEPLRARRRSWPASARCRMSSSGRGRRRRLRHHAGRQAPSRAWRWRASRRSCRRRASRSRACASRTCSFASSPAAAASTRPRRRCAAGCSRTRREEARA